MKTAIITRPIFDARIFADQCYHAGIMPIISPMIDIAAMPPQHINDDYDALIFTSANGVRQYPKSNTSIPVFVVGERTRDEAKQYGYQNIITAKGDVDSLANRIKDYYQSEKVTLRHPAGEDVAGDLQSQLKQDNLCYQRYICYKAHAKTYINIFLRTYLEKHTGLYVCFFSKRTAMIFFHLLTQLQCDIDMKNHHIICLSQAITDYCANYYVDFPHHHIITAPSTEKMIEAILTHKI